MLKHNKLKPVGIAIRLMWNMDKWLLIHSIITSVIEAATPFAGILLSAYILDGLQAGEKFTEIISVSLAAVAVIFLLTVLKAYFSKIRYPDEHENHFHGLSAAGQSCRKRYPRQDPA